MKNLKSIIAACLVAAIITSCKKENEIQPQDLSQQTVAIANENNDAGASSIEGTSVTTIDPKGPPSTNSIVNVSINNSIYHQLPPIKYAGDNEYGGHIKIDGTVNISYSSDRRKVYAVVNAKYIESAGGMDTKAKIDGYLSSNRILLYTAPAGKKVQYVIGDTGYIFSWHPPTNYHGSVTITNSNTSAFLHKIQMIGDTTGNDLPSDGTTDNARFRIWFDDFTISLINI